MVDLPLGVTYLLATLYLFWRRVTGVEDFIALGVFNISRMFRIRRLSILYSSSFRLMLTGVYKVK